jgi:hypothetical protein
MVIALFLFILMLSLFVLLSARLLGVRLSFFRALTASLPGFFTGTGLAALLIKQDYENASSALLFVLFPLLSTMAFIVLMELMARPGSLMRVQGRLASRPRPLRAIGFKLARTRRYIQMSDEVGKSYTHPVGAIILSVVLAHLLAGRYRCAIVDFGPGGPLSP